VNIATVEDIYHVSEEQKDKKASSKALMQNSVKVMLF